MDKFYNKGQIFNDSQDLLQEDIQNIVTDGQADGAERMVESAADNYPGMIFPVMGISSGLILTPSLSGGLGVITVGIGKAYDYDGMLLDSDGSLTLTGLAHPADTGKYVILNGVEADDITTTRQNYVGAVAATRRQITVTVSKSATLPSGVLVTSGAVVLGRIVAFDGTGLPLLGTTATATMGTAILATGTFIAPVRGYAGNNYYYWFEAEEGGTTPSVAWFQNTLKPSSYYLKVKIPTSGGVILTTCTNTAIDNVVFASGAPFWYNTNGMGGSVFTGALSTSYVNFTTGSDYRQYFQTKVGSYGLSDPYRLTPDDPYTQHIGDIGSGTPTTGNPHGQALEDFDTGLDIMALQEHRRKEHTYLSGIDKGATNGYLGAILDIGNNKVTVVGKLYDVDRAVVNGKAVTDIINYTSSSDFTFAAPAINPALYEFGMADTGTIYTKLIATYGTSAGIALFGTGKIYLAIVDKCPFLATPEILQLVVSSSGTVFDVILGAGTSVNLPTANTKYRVYDENGYWIDVVREFIPGDATYSNPITFVASELSTTLPVASIFWRGVSASPSTWGYNNGGTVNGFIEKRVYGTDSMRNDQFDQLGDSLDYGFNYSAVPVVTVGWMTNDLFNRLLPFNVTYRGVDYRFDGQVITGMTGITGTDDYYIVQRFTNNSKTPPLKNYNTRTVAISAASVAALFNQQTDILLGKIHWDAGSSQVTSALFTQQIPFNKIVNNHIRVGIGAWTIYDALSYVELMQTIFPLTAFVLDFVSAVSNTVANRIFAITRLIVKGNGYSWIGNSGSDNVQLTGAGSFVNCFDVKFGANIKFLGTISNATESFVFERCNLLDTYDPSSANWFIKTAGTLASVRFRDFAAIITGAGEYRIVWNATGATYVQNDNPAIAGVEGEVLYVTYSTGDTTVQEDKGVILYGDYWCSGDAGLRIKKTAQTWATSNIGIEANLTNAVSLAKRPLFIELYNNDISYNNAYFIYAGATAGATTEGSVIVKGNNIADNYDGTSEFIHINPATGTMTGQIDICDNNFNATEDDAALRIFKTADINFIYDGSFKYSNNKVAATKDSSTGIFDLTYATTGVLATIVRGLQINNNTIFGMTFRINAKFGNLTSPSVGLETCEIDGLYLTASKIGVTNPYINLKGNRGSLQNIQEIEYIDILNNADDQDFVWLINNCRRTSPANGRDFAILSTANGTFTAVTKVVINNNYVMFTTLTYSDYTAYLNGGSGANYILNSIQINGADADHDIDTPGVGIVNSPSGAWETGGHWRARPDYANTLTPNIIDYPSMSGNNHRMML